MKDTTSVQKHLENIINDAFARVDNAYRDPEKSIIIFPSYRKERGGIPRVSEQELRFAFVEAFIEYINKNCLHWHYAVEVPTSRLYSFKNKEPKPTTKNDMEGRSAMFDMAIYSEHHTLLCVIEFKAKNPELFAYKKDFVKLMNPDEGNPDTLRYFIQIVGNSDAKTIKSIETKYEEARGYAKTQLGNACENVITEYRSMNHRGNK